MVALAVLPVLIEKLNEHKKRLLLVAQVGLPDKQYEAYRKFLLDELGRNGFESELEEALQHMERAGQERAGIHMQERRCRNE